MPQPTPGDVYVSAPLTNVAIAYAQEASYMAEAIAPTINVDVQGGLYRTYNQEDWFRSEAQERAPATESVGSGFRLGQDTYFARVYAVHKDVDDQTRANQQAPINLDRDASRWVTQQLLIKREQIAASSFFTTGVWGTDLTGVSGAPAGGQFQQFDQTASDPIRFIRGQVRTMQEATGYRPNTLVIGARVLDALLDHATIIERIKYTQAGFVSLQLLASAFDIERVIVPEAIQNTAAEGLTGAYSFIFGKSMLLAYVNRSPSPLTPSAAYTFSWTGYVGAQAMGLRVKRFRLEAIASDRVEGEFSFTPKIVAPTLGRFYSGAVA